MSQFANQIPDDLRQQLSVPPPPMWNRRTGELIPYGDASSGRYADLAVFKSGNVVYVDEELDVFDHPGSTCHYRMMIRHMPFSADLQLVLRAAQHMLLIGEYSCEYEHRECLSPDMEAGFWDVKYVVPMEQFKVGSDSLSNVRVSITYTLRKRIWLELFAAMGHKVKWGGSILNVRKRR